jgi:hypothetical protein
VLWRIFHVIDDEKLYDEIGRVWFYFDSWREKIFGGYLAALAALAFAFWKDASVPIRAGIFAFAIVVSVVFRILDLRTTDFINLCEEEAGKLAESKGFYGEFNQRRFGSTTRLTFGMAINILVASILGASAAGFCWYVRLWLHRSAGVSLCWAAVAFLLCIIFYFCLWWVSHRQFSEAKLRHSKGDSPSKT